MVRAGLNPKGGLNEIINGGIYMVSFERILGLWYSKIKAELF